MDTAKYHHPDLQDDGIKIVKQVLYVFNTHTTRPFNI